MCLLWISALAIYGTVPLLHLLLVEDRNNPQKK
jgi:hypothetical protein